MKTISSLNSRLQQGTNAGLLFAGVWLISSLLLTAQETPKSADDKKPAEPAEYNNWITLGVGSTFIDGDATPPDPQRAVRRRGGFPLGRTGR